MASILIGLSIFATLQVFSYGSILQISVVQSFILLAILLYIPQMYENFHHQDIWLFTHISGVFAAISFSFEQGFSSFVLVIPWFISSIIIWVKQPPKIDRDVNLLLILSSKIFLIAAPSVLLISRYGLRPLGFTHQLIELTVIHFHYAGVLIPLFVSKINQNEKSKSTIRLGYIISIGTIIVASGISIGKFIPEVGIFAVLFFTIPLLYLSIIVIKGNYNYWLKIAHGMLMITMVLAIYYALGVSFNITTISIPNMITTHGVVNGLGYVPLSIIGWHNQKQSY